MNLSLKKRKSEQKVELPVLRADPAVGLTAEQAEERRQAGYANTPVKTPGKSVAQIIFSNVFTYFNLIFFFLAAWLLFYFLLGFLAALKDNDRERLRRALEDGVAAKAQFGKGLK